MQIFIVSCVFPPEPITSASTSADLADEMVKRGHRVVVFAPFPNRPSGYLVNGYVRKWKQIEHKNGYKIVYSWHTLSRKSNYYSRAAENISFGLTSTWQMMGEGTPDVAYINTWPLFSQNLNSFFLKKVEIPIVGSVQDIYPEVLVGNDPGRLNVFYRTIRRANMKYLHQCAKVITISSGMRDVLTEDRGLPAERVRRIPNWTDTSKFASSQPRNGCFRQEFAIRPEVFLALFAGGLTRAAGVELYVKVAELLSSRNDIALLLVGDGSMREKLLKRIASLKLTNIRVVYPLHSDQVPEVQAAADVLLLSLSGEMSESALPSKLIHYMLSKRPIVASVNPGNAAARIITEADAGFLLPPEDPKAVADLLIRLSKDHSALNRLGANGRKYAKKHFSKEILLPQLASLLESVGSGKPI